MPDFTNFSDDDLQRIRRNVEGELERRNNERRLDRIREQERRGVSVRTREDIFGAASDAAAASVVSAAAVTAAAAIFDFSEGDGGTAGGGGASDSY